MTFPLTINSKEEIAELAKLIASELRQQYNLPTGNVGVLPLPPAGSFMARLQAAEAALIHKKTKEDKNRD